MHIDELEDALSEILPSGFEISVDRKGRVVIKTTFIQDEDGELLENEEDDEDGVFDDETEQLSDEDDEDE